jgi:hypothetical protein
MDEKRIGEEAKAAAETVADLAHRARTKAVETGGVIREAAMESGKQVGDFAAQTYRQGVRASEYVSRNTAEQPFLALLAAGIVGFGLAYMIYRR